MTAPDSLSLRGTRPRAVLFASALATLAVFAGCGQASPGNVSLGAPAVLPRAHGSHVVVVVLENAEYGEVIGSSSAPYVNSLAHHYGLMTQSYAISHPSLPNYLALTSGSTQGVESDCTDCSVVCGEHRRPAGTRGRLVEGVSGGRAEDVLPRRRIGRVRKEAQPVRVLLRHRALALALRAADRASAQLARDVRSGHLPTYAWISPNLCDDGHDCGVAGADRFLARSVPALLRELGPHGFLVLQWDEGTSDRGCCGAAKGGHIATIVAGPPVRPGARSATPIDQYGVLGSIEQALGLPALGRAADARSGRLTPLFTQAPRVR